MQIHYISSQFKGFMLIAVKEGCNDYANVLK